nr:amidoligase family protein [uncultured Celeribacter sp.]
MDTLADTTFLPLPAPLTAEGRPRRTGVEIEFGGLEEHKAAELVQQEFGGTLQGDGPHGFRVKDSRIGEVKIYLDTALRAKAEGELVKLGLNLSRAVVPVEIVTEPLTDLSLLTALTNRLRTAGAEGSGDDWVYGFGVHFNPEVVALTAAHVVPVAKSYALLEDYLRDVRPIDPSRRLLPFTDPYPRSYLDAICGRDFNSLHDFMRVYLAETPNRNRGLDLLPLLRSFDADAFMAQTGEKPSVSARPTYHFRLPDCRIDEPDWSLAQEWRRWVLVERVAEDATRLSALEDTWQAYRNTLLEGRPAWRRKVSDILGDLAGEVLDGMA